MDNEERQQLKVALENLKTLLRQDVTIKKIGGHSSIHITANINIISATTRKQYVSVKCNSKGRSTPKIIDISFHINNKDQVLITVFEDGEMIHSNYITDIVNNTGAGYYWYMYGKLRELDLTAAARTDLSVFLVDKIIEASPFYNEYSVLPV